MINSQLHEDLVTEILLRVPVKSLIRFKCVSKSWRSLISTPRFATLHHKRASIKRIFVSISPNEVASLDCDRSTFTGRNPPPFQRSLKSSFPVSLSEFDVVGSSNGLICVSSGMSDHNLWVWNPCTSESIQIVPDLKYKTHASFFVTRVGFGYYESGDYYKIVVATCGYPSRRDIDPIISIYSSKTGTWRCLADTEGLNLFPYGQRSGLLVNGALHWQLGITINETKIMAFDLTEESFRVLRPPSGVGIVYGRQIGILNELLCFSGSHYNHAQDTLHHCIWAMQEYGVQTSWTKLFTIADPTSLFFESLPLCSTECGEIICTGWDSGFVLFNPEKDTLLHWIYHYSRATVYVETLISPKVVRAKGKKNDLDGKGFQEGEEKDS